MNLTSISKQLGISKSYLSDIINGKKGCSKELMTEIKKCYPDLDFYIFTKPRYKIKRRVINNVKNSRI